MKKKTNKIHWFFVTLVAIYGVFTILSLPITFALENRLQYLAPQYILPFALPVALIPFLIIRYFPDRKLSNYILRKRKVFKIIVLILAGQFVIGGSMMLFMVSHKSLVTRTTSFKEAFNYVKNDTTLTNRIGIVIDYKTPNSFHVSSDEAIYTFVIISDSMNAIVYISLSKKGRWIVKDKEYHVKDQLISK